MGKRGKQTIYVWEGHPLPGVEEKSCGTPPGVEESRIGRKHGGAAWTKVGSVGGSSVDIAPKEDQQQRRSNLGPLSGEG